MQPEQERKLNIVFDSLIGIDGNPSLLKNFEELAKSHYKLRNRFFMLVAFLAGLGVLGVGASVSQFFL